MATNNRISSFEEQESLSSFDSSFIQSSFNPSIGNDDDDALFLITTSGIGNEKISFKNLKKSILDTSVLLSGDQNIRGQKTFLQECLFIGGVDIASHSVEDYIYHSGDPSTYIQFNSGEINLSADKAITIDCSGSFMSINNSGSVSINSQETSGALNISGDAFLDEVFVLNSNDEFQKVISNIEDSVNFTTKLNQGESTHNIDLPKTFQEPPSIFLTLEETDINNSISQFQYSLNNIKESSFEIAFPSPLMSDSINIHVLAKPKGVSSSAQTKTVSFIKDLNSGESSFQVDFPELFNDKPIISTSLEASFHQPYILQNTTIGNFQILFESGLQQNAKLHVHATR